MFAINDNSIWPRLIMIIIKIAILYVIQITHTDDFPSTGTRLVRHKEGNIQNGRQGHHKLPHDGSRT